MTPSQAKDLRRLIAKLAAKAILNGQPRPPTEPSPFHLASVAVDDMINELTDLGAGAAAPTPAPSLIPCQAEQLWSNVDLTKPCPIMRRMRINQPSTLQPLHRLHGTNVLATTYSGDVYRVFFLDGDVISQQMPRGYLSGGWQPAKGQDDASVDSLRRLPAAVVAEATGEVIFRGNSSGEAEAFIAGVARKDPDEVHAGAYGIDVDIGEATMSETSVQHSQPAKGQ